MKRYSAAAAGGDGEGDGGGDGSADGGGDGADDGGGDGADDGGGSDGTGEGGGEGEADGGGDGEADCGGDGAADGGSEVSQNNVGWPVAPQVVPVYLQTRYPGLGLSRTSLLSALLSHSSWLVPE